MRRGRFNGSKNTRKASLRRKQRGRPTSMRSEIVYVSIRARFVLLLFCVSEEHITSVLKGKVSKCYVIEYGKKMVGKMNMALTIACEEVIYRWLRMDYFTRFLNYDVL